MDDYWNVKLCCLFVNGIESFIIRIVPCMRINLNTFQSEIIHGMYDLAGNDDI